MTKEQIDFLTEFKKQIFKYAIYYTIIAIIALGAFIYNTNEKLATLQQNQEYFKSQQAEIKSAVNEIIKMHLKP